MPEEKKMTKTKVQNIILENRKKLSISGVTDVLSFDDETILVDTELGILIIRGHSLHINKLSIENSELFVEGEILSCEYEDNNLSKGKSLGFLSKLFK